MEKKQYRISANGNFIGNAWEYPFTTKEKAIAFAEKMIETFGIPFTRKDTGDDTKYTSTEECRIDTPHYTDEGIWGHAEIRITAETIMYMDDQPFIPTTSEGYTYKPITRETYEKEKAQYK